MLPSAARQRPSGVRSAYVSGMPVAGIFTNACCKLELQAAEASMPLSIVRQAEPSGLWREINELAGHLGVRVGGGGLGGTGGGGLGGSGGGGHGD
jgi:hypothetical protein